MYDLNISGYMDEYALKVIEDWAKEVPSDGVVVEIGSHLGRSSYCWAKSIPETATLFCIDTWDNWHDVNLQTHLNNRYELFLENTKSCNNIIPLKGKAQYIDYPGNPIDILYLDSNHFNPEDLQILLYFKKFFKPNAKICGHDYITGYRDVKQTVKILEGLYKTKVKLFKNTTQWEIQT